MTSESCVQRLLHLSRVPLPRTPPTPPRTRCLSLLPELAQLRRVELQVGDCLREPLGPSGPGTHHMLSSVRSSRVRPKESTYLSTLRFLSVSWAELKLDTTRVAIPKHLRTEK